MVQNLEEAQRGVELEPDGHHFHLSPYQNGISAHSWSSTTTIIPNGHCHPKYHEEEEEALGKPNGTGISTEWKKILYHRQGVPDNYVPPTFLKDLKKNVNLKKYNLGELILATTALTQQILLVIDLVLMFYCFDSFDSKHDQTLVGLITSITLTFYVLILITSHNEFTQIQTAFIFLVTCFAASPILKNLTETVSTDTIYTMCGAMMLGHLVSHNYGIEASVVSSVVSLNAAFFASVTLASRLTTSFQAFAFLIFATDLFVLLNFLYQRLSLTQKTVFTALLGVATTLIFHFTFSLVHATLFSLFLLFINFLCPYIFFRMQSLKENIYGPWDEAIINHSTLYLNCDLTPPSSPEVSKQRYNQNQEEHTMDIFLNHHHKRNSDQKKHL